MKPKDVWREFIAATDFDALADEMSGELGDYSDLLDLDHKPTEP